MEPIYRKCLLAAKQINEKSIPELYDAYRYLMEGLKNKAENLEEMNRARQITQSAKKAETQSDIDNKHVYRYVSELSGYDYKITQASRFLTDEIYKISRDFRQRAHTMERKNLAILQQIKNSEIPAKELLESLVQLGKEIVRVQNEVLAEYKQTIDSYLTKTVNNIVPDVEDYYEKINKLDSGTLPRLITKEWTYVPSEIFRTSGAFMYEDQHEVKSVQ